MNNPLQEHTHVKNLIPAVLESQKKPTSSADLYYLERIAKSYKPAPTGLIQASFKNSCKAPVKDALPSCTRGFITGVCTGGHAFAKAIMCGREYCPTCGEKWSWCHQRSYYRWLPKVMAMDSVGYLVVTVPEELREFFRDRIHLNTFRRYLIRMFKRSGYERGLARWHWCGEDGKTWKPHLNFLFPGAWMAPHDRDELREKVTKWLSLYSKKTLTTTVLHYQYSNKAWKKKHWCKYVTRATWRQFSYAIAQVTHRYRNNVSWGEWTGLKKDNDVSKLERGCCPLCDGNIKWEKMRRSMYLGKYIQLKAGYFIDINAPP